MTTTTLTEVAVESRTPTATEMLLAVLADALSACEERDLDLLDGRSRAGSALLSLSAIARRAVAVLGAGAGVQLTDGAGVVVVRDLVVATRLLSRNADGRAADDVPEVQDLLAVAKGVHATLLETMTAAA